jgi:arabinose-5-phosphate isomerase
MCKCTASFVISGIGKSGIIGRKFAATLNSLGFPSLFLHPCEATHGDLGCIRNGSVVILVSNSGETAEILHLANYFKKNNFGISLMAIIANSKSKLSELVQLSLSTGEIEEICPLGLAPTSSTTALLALGDALSMTLFNVYHLGSKTKYREIFSRLHPGGRIGYRLQIAKDIMQPCGRLCTESDPVQSLIESLEVEPGIVCVIDDGFRFSKLYTSSDKNKILSEIKSFPGKIESRRIADLEPSSDVSKVSLNTHIDKDSLTSDWAVVLDERYWPLGIIDLKNTIAIDIKGCIAILLP